jgi:hypothetical protein
MMPTKTSAGTNEVVRLGVLRLTPPLHLAFGPYCYCLLSIIGIGLGLESEPRTKAKAQGGSWHLYIHFIYAYYMRHRDIATCDMQHATKDQRLNSKLDQRPKRKAQKAAAAGV